MTGDNNGRFGGDYDWPDDTQSYIYNIKDTILRLRIHACILLYCGGNEIGPPDSSPPKMIANGIRDTLATYDPHRFYISSSMYASPTTGEYNITYALSPMDGPYGLLLPSQWYAERNPGLGGYNTTPISYQPEVGSVSTPTLKSLRRFLSAKSLADFSVPPPLADETDVHYSWRYHKYLPYTSKSHNYDHIYAYYNTTAITMHDYIWASQLVQYQQYKSLIEGYIIQQYIYYTAVYIWKSQSPWPTLRGALYDYHLDSTGGYWGIRSLLVNKSEKRHWPVILMNLHTRYLVLINRLFTPVYTPITALVECTDLSGAVIYTDRYTFRTPLPANGVLTSTYAVPKLAVTHDIQGYICFLFLTTTTDSTSKSGIGIASFHLPNMYWFSSTTSTTNTTANTTANSTASSSSNSGGSGSGSGVYEQPDYLGFGQLRKMGLGQLSVTTIQPLTSIPTVRRSNNKGTYEQEDHNYDMLQYSDIYPLLNDKMKRILDNTTSSSYNGRYESDSSTSLIYTAMEPIRLAHYSRLQSLSSANIHKMEEEEEYTVFTILHISCPLTSPVIAFMINLSIINATTSTNSTHTGRGDTKGEVEDRDNRILPTFYSLNYFTLRPGESVYVTIAFNVPTSSTSLNHHGADIRGAGGSACT